MQDNYDRDSDAKSKVKTKHVRNQDDGDSGGPFFEDINQNSEIKEFDQNELDSETTNSDLERSLIKKRRQSNLSEHQPIRSNLKGDKNRQSKQSAKYQNENIDHKSNGQNVSNVRRMSMENMQRIRQRDTSRPNSHSKVDTKVTFRNKEINNKSLFHSQQSSGYVSGNHFF